MQKTLYAGDTIKQVVSSADYPATDGWTLKGRFAPVASGTPVTITAATADNGADYVLTVPAATTGGWDAGNWQYTLYVELAGERHTIEVGNINVLANPASATAGADTRSHVKKTLDALEAMIEGKAGKDVQSYSINGRQLQHYSFPDLIILRDKYLAEYAREQQTASGKPGGRGRKIHVRF
ncbi:hypothetical protein Q9292_09900 [Methylophilus sp. VKM B-3414]|uniref:hypothetical protein n=1 Tax=Methylophilus sp. VKM B-3414 TaxID=3076121 RepID=UPI0028C74E18|nr:hypothetical protein [Methylophilus sp. VKM B-3414]MDT7849924.1 hypothetical protein [Methylophilus sp. VKM B-3414]